MSRDDVFYTTSRGESIVVAKRSGPRTGSVNRINNNFDIQLKNHRGVEFIIKLW